MSLDQPQLPEADRQAILDEPALAPPLGVIPNLDNPPNQNALGLAVTTICLSISTMAIILAAYAKLRCGNNFHYEDSAIYVKKPTVIYQGFTVGVTYCLYENYAGVGFFVNQWNVRVRDWIHMFYIVYVGFILYAVAIMFLKVAIHIQWIRLFVPRNTKGLFYWTSHSSLWANVLLYSSVVIAICASCKPFPKLWDMALPGTCTPSGEIINISSAIANLASDIIILLLPQCVIWRLKMKRWKKVIITFAFCVGIFAVISAAFRVHSAFGLFRSNDKTYQINPVAFWAIAELTCGILIYCVPTIPKIFRGSGPSSKSRITPVSWLKSPLSSTRLESRGFWTSPGSEEIPLDNLWEPSFGDTMASGLCNPAKVQLGRQISPAYDMDIQPSRYQSVV